MFRLTGDAKIKDICAFFPSARRILKRYQLNAKTYPDEPLDDICRDLGIKAEEVLDEILDEQALSN